jgi:type IV pilus assembly protein PilE
LENIWVKAMKRSTKGFTLVELMVTLAVLAILITIGYPLYNQILQKARRVDAKDALLLMAQAQVRYNRMFFSYAATSNQLNFGPDELDNDINDTHEYNEVIRTIDHNQDGNPDYYTITITTDGDATTYLITATAISDQLNDTDCRTLTINQFGLKTAVDEDGNDTTARCW